MRAGKLDREIVIQRQAGTTQSASGKPVESWVTFASVWASVVPLSATERFRSDAKHSVRVSSFSIRWLDGVLPTMRIVYEGLNWRILGIAELGRRDGLEITAEAVY